MKDRYVGTFPENLFDILKNEIVFIARFYKAREENCAVDLDKRLV